MGNYEGERVKKTFLHSFLQEISCGVAVQCQKVQGQLFSEKFKEKGGVHKFKGGNDR